MDDELLHVYHGHTFCTATSGKSMDRMRDEHLRRVGALEDNISLNIHI